MCKLQSPITSTKPDITFYEIGWQTVESEFDALDIHIPLGLFDAFQPYYYTTLWGIKEAVKYCGKVYPFPKYKTASMDCDDFAVLMKGLMSAEFGINDFGIALGVTPQGYHAFNISRVEDRRVLIEPQTGEVFEIGEKGYQCDKVIQ
uniref:Agglutinin C-terminal domain-containing protein n=1 Tax=viral metagenome TaxID=1070528 RepID=A0A6M3IF18_9ZZZZ